MEMGQTKAVFTSYPKYNLYEMDSSDLRILYSGSGKSRFGL